MPSSSRLDVLEPLLSDVSDLIGAHKDGRTGTRGRQWHLSGLNRSIVVMAVSAWEAYVEHVVVESVEALRPAGTHLGTWPSLKASVSSAKGRFHTPNTQNVRGFVRDSIGIPDVTARWKWQGTPAKQARKRLEKALLYRHQIAHGVHPRPTVHHDYAKRLPNFFRKLGERTDDAIRDYLDAELGVSVNW